MSEAQVVEVDGWIGGYKTFDSYQPAWQPVKGRGRDWQARWPLVDQNDIASGFVVFEADAGFTEISISVIYRGSPVYRLDLCPPGQQHGNEFVARKYAPDLPRKFTGSHIHGWEDTRGWVKDHGLGEMPLRRPLENPPTDFDEAFEFVAKAVNITVQPGTRPVTLPPQRGLSLGKRR